MKKKESSQYPEHKKRNFFSKMPKMKSVFYSFIVAMISGGGGIYCLLNISTPARATMTVSSSDPDTKITGEHLDI